MSNIAETFDIDVANETYTITRVLENRNEKTETYGFKTVIDGKEYSLRAKLSTETAQNLYAQHGIRVLDELANVLITEFQLEIEKIKDAQ